MNRIQTFFGTIKNGIDRSVCGLYPIEEYKQLLPPSGVKNILFLDQVHSHDVVVINDLNNLPSLKADAVVTALPGLALVMKTADCAPVFLHDERAGVIGAIHSGWQGTALNVVAPTVDAMLAKGADKARIKAQIGPCLQRSNFTMGGDVFDQFIAAHPYYCNFFTVHPTEKDKYLFDNTAAIAWQLKESGIINITSDKTCTLANARLYYSYRYRNQDPQHDMMRNISAIWMI
jgi:YfiH family protein